MWANTQKIERYIIDRWMYYSYVIVADKTSVIKYYNEEVERLTKKLADWTMKSDNYKYWVELLHKAKVRKEIIEVWETFNLLDLIK